VLLLHRRILPRFGIRIGTEAGFKALRKPGKTRHKKH